MTGNNAHDMRVAPDRLYWARFSVERAARPRREELDYRFEELLPVPIEEVHAAYARASDGAWIGCAINRAELERAVDNGARSLRPSSLPGFLADGPAPERFELMTGAFEPRAARRARRSWTLQTCAAITITTALLCLGAESRLAALQRDAGRALDMTGAVHREVLGTAPSALPPALHLQAERRRLEQIPVLESDTDAHDAAAPLADVLRAWPEGLDVQTELLSVTGGLVTVVAGVPDPATGEAFVAAMGRVHGWRCDQPQVTSARGSVRITVRLRQEDQL